MPVTEQLAQHITSASFDAMPAEVVEAAKVVILDGLAVTLAGSQETAAQIVAEYAREMGGNPQCSAFGHGFRTSPPMAAFVNGVAGHVLDYEVMWHPATHATSPTLPGIMALAESRERHWAGHPDRADNRIRGAGTHPRSLRRPLAGGVPPAWAGGSDGQRRRRFGDAGAGHPADSHGAGNRGIAGWQRFPPTPAR